MRVEPQIYELMTDSDYVGLTFIESGMWTFPQDGQMDARLAKGGVFKVELNDENVDPESEILPDFVRFCPGFCCMRKAAWIAVSALLKVNGPTVTLRVVGRDEEYVLFEPSPKMDVLDFDRSDVQFFDPPSTRIKWVENVVVRNTATIDTDIFGISGIVTKVFCTEACRRVVNQNALTGLLFKPVTVTS